MFSQQGHDARLEWGLHGLHQLAPHVDFIVIVDVLSFCTAVDVALGRGAVVLPFRWRDERAAAFAAAEQATLASPDRAASLSLSPRSLQNLSAGTRLVLPSPNGATLAAAAAASAAPAAPQVLCACLRNAAAVGAWLRDCGGTVALIPAGERWPTADAPLRPALEDLLGAGAVLDALAPRSPSPEAQAAIHTFRALRPTLEEALQGCGSGRELILRGFAEDVSLAARLNSSPLIPCLQDGVLVPGASSCP